MRPDWEQEILQAVENSRAQIFAFVQKIVQVKSLPTKEADLGSLLLQQILALGLKEAEVVEKEPGHPNLLVRLTGDGNGPTLTFNGHMDTIFEGPAENWAHPPYAGEMVDGKLYGRGTVDMKSGLCASFLAAGILNQLKVPLKGQVLLTAVCDEEICGDRGILHLLQEGYIAKKRPDDMAISCEPSKFAGKYGIIVATKGILRAHIHIYGGKQNAIAGAAWIANRIHLLAAQISNKHHPLLGPPSILLAMVKGDAAYCKLSLTRRMLPGESKEEAIGDYEAILNALAVAMPELKTDLEVWPGFRPPMDVGTSGPAIVALQKAYQMVKGTKLPVVADEGATDAAFVAEKSGLPMVIFGPGDIELIAATDEYVIMEEVVDAVKVYALAIYYALGKERAES